jgi:hypothetical protein
LEDALLSPGTEEAASTLAGLGRGGDGGAAAAAAAEDGEESDSDNDGSPESSSGGNGRTGNKKRRKTPTYNLETRYVFYRTCMSRQGLSCLDVGGCVQGTLPPRFDTHTSSLSIAPQS